MTERKTELLIEGMIIKIEAKKALGLKPVSISAHKNFRNKVIKDWELKEDKKYEHEKHGMFYLMGIPVIEAEHLPGGVIIYFSDGSQEYLRTE